MSMEAKTMSAKDQKIKDFDLTFDESSLCTTQPDWGTNFLTAPCQ